MNFSSHQTKIVESIEVALTKALVFLINDFKFLLSNAKELFDTKVFDFWIKELGLHDPLEIPITKYGHRVAISYLKSLKNSDRNSCVTYINWICNWLFCYVNEKEIAPEQGDYQYYYCLSLNMVYKDSGTHRVPEIDVPKEGDYHVALKSQLDTPENEFYI